MFASATYSARRSALIQRLGSGIVLLPANSESPTNYPSNTYRFRQDSTFLYFFGINHPDYVGWIDIDSGEQWLFGEDYTIDDIVWMGPQPSLAQQGEQVGVSLTGDLSTLQSKLTEALQAGRTIHYLPPYRGETTLKLCRWLSLAPEQIASRSSVELAIAVVALREIKSEEEIEQMEIACGIGHRMHLRAMQMAWEGTIEQEIAAAIEAEALRDGWGVSFHSIVSQHGETLHNHNHSGVLENGRLLLVDAGAESNLNYCSDFTRTLPVGGKFSTRQKEVYDLVLTANNHIFTIARPDRFYWEMHNASALILSEGLKALGLMRGDMQEAVAVGAQALFMPHGLGHQIGLDVHDMENIGEQYVGYDEQTLRSSTPGLSSLRMGKRLQAGQVITVEPGLYFIPALIDKWEREGLGGGFINFEKARSYSDFGGIRIEDDLLITTDGCRMMGKERTPVTTDEVETYMANYKR